jgi:Domain of unknown function (DUF4276)
MKEIVFCLEELSAQSFLESLLGRINLGNVPVRYIVFEGKQDLESQLTRRLRGYRNTEAIFIVMRDQDSAPDCKIVKNTLRSLCDQGQRPNAIVRIACRELEAFYWGDLSAVEQALQTNGLAQLSRRRRFRDPDRIVNPSTELRKVTRGRYQKVSGSREIGKCISIDNIGSKSFQVLLQSIQAALAA